MVKTFKSISIDYDLVAEVEAKGLKLSTVLNQLLKAHLDKLNEPEEIKGDLEESKIELVVQNERTKQIRDRITRLEKEKQAKVDKEEAEWKEWPKSKAHGY